MEVTQALNGVLLGTTLSNLPLDGVNRDNIDIDVDACRSRNKVGKCSDTKNTTHRSDRKKSDNVESRLCRRSLTKLAIELDMMNSSTVNKTENKDNGYCYNYSDWKGSGVRACETCATQTNFLVSRAFSSMGL